MNSICRRAGKARDGKHSADRFGNLGAVYQIRQHGAHDSGRLEPTPDS